MIDDIIDKLLLNKYVRSILKLIFSLCIYLVMPGGISLLFNSIINYNNLNGFITQLLGILSYIITLLLIVLVYRKTLIRDYKIFTDNKTNVLSTSIKYWITGFIVMLTSNIIISNICGMAGNEATNRDIIGTYPIYGVIVMVLIGPIIEEIIFRRSIRDMFKNIYFYSIISALLFASVHLVSDFSLIKCLYLIPYGALGYAFAYTYYKTDTIYSSILMHCLHNALVVFSVLFTTLAGV